MSAEPSQARAKRPAADQFRFDPDSEPDWRFARVLTMVAHEPRALRCKMYDDEYIREMRKFMLLYQPRNSEARMSLYVQFPGPFHAMRIHESISPELSLYVQCRILAKQSDEEIAARVGTTPDAIFWYEKIFYDVRDRLDNWDWIIRHVLGPAQIRNLSNVEYPFKLFAFFGGPEVLDFLISGFRGIDRPQTAGDVDRFIADSVVSGVWRRAAMAVNAFSINKFNVMPLLDLCRQIRADSRGMDDMTSENDSMFSAVRETLQGIEFLKGDRAIEALSRTTSDLLRFDESAVDLRDHELYAVATGKAEELEHLLHVKMPPPRSQVHEDLADQS